MHLNDHSQTEFENGTPEEELDETQLAAQVLATEIPAEARLITPTYYIDFFTDPQHPVYYENGSRFEIRYNPHIESYFTLVEGYRLITFQRLDSDLLVKSTDYDLHEHRFTYADIFTADMLVGLAQAHSGSSVDEFVELMGIPDLLSGQDNEMNVERVLAEVFGQPIYNWGWYMPGANYGIEILSVMGVMRVFLVDEERIISRMKKPRRRRDRRPQNQLVFRGEGWDELFEV